ncbi:hypothetical protein NKI48_03005 [Mesorhizobium sp. M0644]|uniref:hypothetical protein n=1 Tax=Mesorhizobium sp. M0644 TaxID=2956979 RepID=UPI00333D1EBD
MTPGEPITYATKLHCIRQIIVAKNDWLEKFSSGRNARPDHEIAAKRTEVIILRTIEEDYRVAVDVEAGRAA